MKFNFCLFPALVLLMCVTPAICNAADDTLWEFGARSGFSFINKGKNFEMTSLYLQRDLPWRWNILNGLVLGTRGESAAGVLVGRNVTGFIGSIGPDIFLEMADIVQLHGGVHLAVLSEKDYHTRDFGGRFQFINHGGLSFRIGKHLNAGYRYQHMSNADIYDNNPGLNLHMLEIGYRF